jgi:HEAT repeat protein
MSGEMDRDKTEERLEYFLRMLKDENPGKRWKAAESLARIGDDRAVEPLITALDDEDWRVRQKSAWALGYLGDPRALGPLRHALKDDLEGVQEMVRESIVMIQRKMTEES